MVSNVCRICLVPSRRLKSIFDCQTTFCVVTFIHELCNISITEKDEFTHEICPTCLDRFQAAHGIRAKCIESNEWLKTQTELNKDPERDKVSVDVEELSQVAIKNECLLESVRAFDDLLVPDQEVLDLKEEDEKAASDFDSVSIDNNDDEESSANESKKTRAVNQEKTQMCSICGKTFFTSGHLRSHELTHNESKEFPCDSCGKQFLTKSYLNRHMKSHLNERNYKCKICLKGFNTSTTLGYHFRLVHSGETKFQCTFCSKGFPLKIQLVSHTRSHTGEKPNKCDQCDKKYSHKIDLKRHQMLHTGNKAYKCPYCERTFTKKSNMECHIPIHTGLKPYKCNICFKEFRQPCPYKKHMQTHSNSTENINPVMETQISLKSSENVSTSMS